MKERIDKREQREQDRKKMVIWLDMQLYEALEELAEYKGKDVQEYAQELVEDAIRKAFMQYIIGW